LLPATGGRGGRGGRGAPEAEPGGVNWRSEFAKAMEDSAAGQLQLYMMLPASPNAIEYRREQELAGKIASAGAGVTIRDASSMFGKARQIKSQRELDILQHAVDITAEAFQRAYTLAVPSA